MFHHANIRDKYNEQMSQTPEWQHIQETMTGCRDGEVSTAIVCPMIFGFDVTNVYYEATCEYLIWKNVSGRRRADMSEQVRNKSSHYISF